MTRSRVVAGGLALALAGLLALPPVPAALAQPNDKAVTNSVGMKLVLIPAGKFVMGSPVTEDERDDEEVPHEVAISRPFYLGAHEVTQGQYDKVMAGKAKNPSFFAGTKGGGADFPVEQVSWAGAEDFCKALSALPAEKKAGRTYRLPTEAEWEYACRAGTATPFHAGNSLSAKQANFNGTYPYGGAPKGPYLARPAKVGSYPPNAWGLYDMHGNVAEWCADWYDPGYYKRSPRQDPPGPTAGVLGTGFRNEHFRVVRGGSWADEARACRSAYRFRLQPSERYRLVGFRVACVVATK